MWLVLWIERYLGADFGFLGIQPLTISGLIGFFTAPLVHGTIDYLISSTLPLLILGGILFYFYPDIAIRVFLQCYFFTNILVWFLGRPFYHIGASGVVYGVAFFLISFGFFRGNMRSLVISAIVIVFYGGIVYTVFPLDVRVSYESHLFGAITGLVTAFLLRKYERSEEG
ncbi:MAG: rhomboid family intramembrane serine protease [Cytophagales bacterium]|nr:rhomboid family intramembrane serine protease [Cytophagales bacterium]